MIYSQNRDDQRAFLINAWNKFKENHILNDIELQLVDIIKIHPEFHELIEDRKVKCPSYDLNLNPFLHINLHLAVREQIAINQPLEIKKIYKKILSKFNDTHQAEHAIMNCLFNCLVDAQRKNDNLNLSNYNKCLHNII